MVEPEQPRAIHPARSCPVCGGRSRHSEQRVTPFTVLQGTCVKGHTWYLKWVTAA